jgi:hypothetical protein
MLKSKRQPQVRVRQASDWASPTLLSPAIACAHVFVFPFWPPGQGQPLSFHADRVTLPDTTRAQCSLALSCH